ncbi:heavy-metal-associated domain-containing protein [Roseibium sp.]|uniref:heavy-metal-associated domain-containing protein n=1 Tax=Roseibium sp. TaxID=1936156 RepID=UPI003A97620C
MKFSFPEMSCGHCKAAISDAVKQTDGTAQLDFDMENRIVTINSVRTPDEITRAVNDASYESELLQLT